MISGTKNSLSIRDYVITSSRGVTSITHFFKLPLVMRTVNKAQANSPKIFRGERAMVSSFGKREGGVGSGSTE